MRRCALLLGFALSPLATSAFAQNCDGFTDVLASSPFCPDVTWLATYGVTKGCGPSQFCPNENVSRLQMAAFMHRLGENPAFVNGGNAFGTAAMFGTTDNNALTVLVNNQRAITVQPAVDTSFFGYNPNVIAGQAGNSVSGGVAGATIAGGGGCNPGSGCSTPTANQVTGLFGTVGGGALNTAGSIGTVAGGFTNTAGPDGTVAGGNSNTASGGYSTVAGGNSNTASADFSVVAGGHNNTASGSNSFAAGTNAQATTDGSFIWADSQPFNFGPSVDNFFGVRATGGVGLTIAIDGSGKVTQYCNLLPPIASWSCTSDRNAKENFIPADGRDILQRLVAMPLSSWNFKGADPTIRSLGPTAQDFYGAFGLGRNDKSIANVNMEGVALAAIQGLNAKLDEQTTLLHATIREQQREIAELTERVQKAESLAADVVALKAALAELQRGRETVAAK